MEKELQHSAKGQMVALMQAGYPWKEAAAMAGVRIGRSAAYQLLRNVRLQGEAALQDGRHGHPAKPREPLLTWLETTCRQAPLTPGRLVQAALQERFGILVSIGHLAPASIALPLPDHPGESLLLRVALIRDLRYHVPVVPSKEDVESPKRWDADLDWHDRMWWDEGWQATPTPAVSTTRQHHSHRDHRLDSGRGRTRPDLHAPLGGARKHHPRFLTASGSGNNLSANDKNAPVRCLGRSGSRSGSRPARW